MTHVLAQVTPSLPRAVDYVFPATTTAVLLWTVMSFRRLSKRIQLIGHELPSLAWIRIPMGEVVDSSTATLDLLNGSSDAIRQASLRIAPCIFDKGDDGLQVAYKAPFRIVNLGEIAANGESQKTDIWADMISAMTLAGNNSERFANGVAGLKITACVRGRAANRTSVFTGEYVVEPVTNGFHVACVREDLSGRVL